MSIGICIVNVWYVYKSKGKMMNMTKYLLLSVVATVVLIVRAEEAVVAKASEPVASKTESPVDAKVKEPVVPTVETAVVESQPKALEPQAEAHESEVAKNSEDDFAEWTKQLDLSDEERAQLLAEMNDEADKEANNEMSEAGKIREDGKSLSDVTPEKTVPAVKETPVKTALPEQVK